MDFENLAELYAVYPEAKNKIHMLSAFAEEKQRNREIADPYYGDEETPRQMVCRLDAMRQKYGVERFPCS